MLQSDILHYYILDENNEVQSVGVDEYTEWLERVGEAPVRIAWDVVNGKLVSTVFLRATVNEDHFETQVFDDAGNGKLGMVVTSLGTFDRYKTYEEAKRGHERIVERVKRGE